MEDISGCGFYVWYNSVFSSDPADDHGAGGGQGEGYSPLFSPVFLLSTSSLSPAENRVLKFL